MHAYSRSTGRSKWTGEMNPIVLDEVSVTHSFPLIGSPSANPPPGFAAKAFNPATPAGKTPDAAVLG
jgi:hypothetical protein